MRKLVFIIILIWHFNIFASELFKISTGPENTPVVTITSNIIKEVYKRINLEIKIENISWSRSIEMANSGESDAELFRSTVVQENFKNIVIVDEPLLILKMVVFTNRDDISIDNWEDLADYRLSFLRGVKAIEEKTKDYNIFPVNSSEEAFKLLLNNRVDIVIREYYTGITTMKKLKLDNIIIIDKPLESIPVYHFLNKKNKHLATVIKYKVKEIYEDGTAEKIINEVIEKIPE